ncbi:hypothetical protein KKE60_06455, partial [Patescibacteria group bacterium]|nr:hypothetical protein [Patescibacteria group bacterium]
MKEPNCKECPFWQGKNYIVPGEGSRLLREWTEDLPSDNKSVVFRKKHVERDNNGQYDIAIIAMAPARE